MKAWTLIAVGLFCVPFAMAEEGDDPPLPAIFPELATETFEGGRRIDLHRVPLLGYAAPRQADGSRSLLLLTRRPRTVDPDEEEPVPERDVCDDPTTVETSLYRLDFDRAEPSLTLLRDDLPGDASSLDALDVDGDGSEEVLLFRPGQVVVLGAPGGTLAAADPEVLVDDHELSRESLTPSVLRDGVTLDEPWLQVPGIGVTRFYRPAEGSVTWAVAAEVEVNVQAFRARDGFNLFSPPAEYLGRDNDGHLVFAGQVEVVDRRRLKVSLIRPEIGEVEECWARLPEPEIPIRRLPLLLNGEPVLLVTTRPAEDFGLFDEQLLRIFPLERDRSRAGREPVVAFKARANLINSVLPQLLDVNADGRQDLVLGYWKGFDLEHVALDVHLQAADGSFPSKPRSTELKVKDGSAFVLSYGSDIDGDGAPDLLLVAGGQVRVHRGTPEGRQRVEKRPGLTAPLGLATFEPDGETLMLVGPDGVVVTVAGEPVVPRAVDLDGDGRSELLIARRGEDGEGSLSLVLFDPAGE